MIVERIAKIFQLYKSSLHTCITNSKRSYNNWWTVVQNKSFHPWSCAPNSCIVGVVLPIVVSLELCSQ